MVSAEGETASRGRIWRSEVARAQWMLYYLGKEAFREEPKERPTISNARLAEIVEAGLPVSVADYLRQRTHMSARKFGHIVPRSTLQSKRKSADKKLSVEQSDRIMRVAQVYAHAAEVFGDSKRAETWMKRTNPRMPDERTPEEILKTSYGARYIDDVLTQFECGIAP